MLSVAPVFCFQHGPCLRPKNCSEDVLAEEVRCREEPDSNDAARYQDLSHTYRFANTGARPTAA